MKRAGFSKNERIVSKKLIDLLFISGQSHSLAAYPLRAVYIVMENGKEPPADGEAEAAVEAGVHAEAEPGAKVVLLLSVPKRRFKHAVDRNRVKRQLREAFRKNKQLLADQVAEGHQVALAFIWLSDKLLPSAEVERSVNTLLQRIAQKIKSTV